VGSILGVTKEVDMVFTRRFEVNRLQVMVVNPNLIPEVVNVVIGDNLYELKFCVEHQMDSSNPQPMEMDNDHYADEGERQMGNKQGANSMDNSNSNTAARKSREQREGKRSQQGVGNKTVMVYHIQVPASHAAMGSADDGLGLMSHQTLDEEDKFQDGKIDDVTSDDDHSHDESVNTEEAEREWKKQLEEENNGTNTGEMAAIHEASPQMSSAKREKRQAGDADADISSKAERLKTLRNEGDKTPPLLFLTLLTPLLFLISIVLVFH
jgi:hypothetical protein